MIRLMLADDQQLVRAGFRSILDDQEGMRVVQEAADGREAVERVREARPDVVLMDIRMPELDGIEATRRIAADPALADVSVIILTTYELDEYIYGALRAGAAGFLLKDAEPAELVYAVRVVARGDALIAPSVTRRLIAEFATRAEPWDAPAAGTLTERERQVLTLIATGLSNAEIAERLALTLATAKTYASRLMAKLGARDRAQLVVYAYEAGVVAPRVSAAGR